MAVGIETLKASIHSLVGIIVEGIFLAKKAPVVIAEARDCDVAEGVALVVQVATEEAPRVMAALKA
jgi:hypothetical protein